MTAAPPPGGDGVQVRAVTAADHAAVLALNTAEVPRVGPLAPAELPPLRAHTDLALVAELAGRIVGFVLAMPPGRSYASPNYRFFEARGIDHLYVDRIATVPDLRRRGVATALSDAVEERARATGRQEVTCEVNVRPPNPVSQAFHQARGFVEVGRQDTGGGALTVALLAKSVTPAGTNQGRVR